VIENSADDVAEGLDQDLWVKAKGYDGRLILGWNPHLKIPGRIGVWSSEHKSGTRISKSDILEAPPESWVWTDAFLIGSEPSLEFMFGELVRDDPDIASKQERWRQRCQEYRTTGNWTGGKWFIPQPLPDGASLPGYVYLRRGDEIWIWENNDWRLAEIQPAFRGDFLEETICFDRGNHGLLERIATYQVCRDCGFAAERH